MKKRIKKTGILTLLCALAILTGSFAQNIYAYDYAQTSATKGGTVKIEVLPANNTTVNGYFKPGKYRVSYTVKNSNWIAFDKSNGCDFYIGDTLKPSGGCHFVYKPDGVIWEQGAIALGYIKDGKVVGSCEPDSNGKVQVSFDVKALTELPAYIAYTYQPAGGAYIHMSEPFGHDHHVWYYQKLNTVTPGNIGSVDTTAPDITASVTAAGKTANVGGKIWGTSAIISATSSDKMSRPAGIRFYKNGGLLYSCTNSSNAESLTGQYTVTENATYQVNAYDQLGNASSNKDVAVTCIDTTAPVVSSFKADNNGYCTNLALNAIASDSGSGLNGTAYSFNGGAWGSSNSLNVIENGTYTLRVRDALDNVSTASYTVSNIDRDGPVLSAECKPIGEEITVGDIKWSKEKNISIAAFDEKSGLEKIVITDENGTEIMSKKGSEASEEGKLSFETAALAAGTYLITAYDALGNTTESCITINQVDNVPPTILDIKQTAIDSQKVRITVSARDNEGGSGLPISKAYSFDGGKTWQDPNYLDVSKNDTYYVAVRDNMGLQAQREENVKSIVSTSDSEKKKPDGKDPGKEEDKKKKENEKKKDNNKKTDKNNSKKKDSDKGNNSGGGNPGGGSSGGNNSGGGSGGSGTDGEQGGKTSNTAEDGKKKSGKGTGTGQSSEKGKNSKTILGGGDYPKTVTINENSLSANTLEGETETTTTFDESFRNRKNEIEKISTKAEEAEKKVKRIATIVLVTILILGLLALGAYFLLAYLYHSCILYAIDDKNNRKRLCRVPVKEISGDWLAEVPDHKLGTFGNGRYLLVFQTPFVKESDPDHVVIVIDGNRIRERLREEIEIKI